MNRTGEVFVDTFLNVPETPPSTLIATVKSCSGGVLKVDLGGAEVTVTRATCACFVTDVAAGKVTAGQQVELSRVKGILRVRGLIQGF